MRTVCEQTVSSAPSRPLARGALPRPSRQARHHVQLDIGPSRMSAASRNALAHANIHEHHGSQGRREGTGTGGTTLLIVFKLHQISGVFPPEIPSLATSSVLPG
jgi:hypothetical protein